MCGLPGFDPDDAGLHCTQGQVCNIDCTNVNRVCVLVCVCVCVCAHVCVYVQCVCVCCVFMITIFLGVCICNIYFMTVISCVYVRML
jgi:hypothetical protein